MTKWNEPSNLHLAPKFKKMPKQDRSRFLVNAIREACQKIMNVEGIEAVNTNRISEVAGVSVASIYQYFPNKDAIIAAVFENLVEEEYYVEVQPSAWPGYEVMDLPQRIEAMIDRGIDFRLRLLLLAPDFFQKYHREYELMVKFGLQNAINRCGDLFARFEEQMRVDNNEIARYMLVRAIGAIIDKMAEDAPEKLKDDTFRKMLKEMALRLFIRDS